MQDLANGHLDVKALGEAANGDENTIVTTRTGNTYPSAERAINIMFQNGGLPAEPFATKAQMETDGTSLADGQLAQVYNEAANNGLYVKTAGAWVKSDYNPAEQAITQIYKATGKNLFDKKSIVSGSQFSPSTGKFVTSGTYRRSGFVPVTGGQTYTLSGNNPNLPQIGWFATNDINGTALSTTSTQTATAPAGANFAVFNVTNLGVSDTTYDNTLQLEKGSTSTAYQAYSKFISQADVAGLQADMSSKITNTDIFAYDSFNKIDVSKVDFKNRYQAGTKAIIFDTLGIAASDWIPVTAGEWYALSGEYYGNTATPQGGYFTAYGQMTGLQDIVFAKPVDNVGHAFKVPTGLGITHVVISLRKAGDAQAATTLAGNVQLEKGEMATAYQPYLPKAIIKPSLLSNSTGSSSGGGSAGIDDASWYKYVSADGGKIYQDKLPKFRKAMLLKDKDVNVVMTGTSLTARTSEHSTLRADAAFRPPMMHSNAFCSHTWDALKWEGQQYRRYDAVSTFTETGAFLTSSSLPEWDDGAYRDGLTRYSAVANAAVSFTVPIDAWQFNFIYRTDSLGCAAKVAITEGVGEMQVYDEATSTWVEAHNYAFSMLETAPVARSIVTYDPINDSPTTRSFASKANTTYQKRLKMRCRSTDGTLDSLASVKTVTISRTGGGARFMYWGIEYSPREFMISFINSSRGSHFTEAKDVNGLPRYQDNEVWGFKPDLILSELAIHNDGAANAAIYPVGRWAGLTKNYVDNTAFELSLYSRAAYFTQAPEYAFFMGTITYGFNGIDDNGKLKYGMQTASVNGAAKTMTALDKYQEAVEYLKSKDIVVIDTAQRWVDAGNSIYGDLKSATVGSGKGGNTLTNEGSHWNDTGGKIMAKAVIPII